LEHFLSSVSVENLVFLSAAHAKPIHSPVRPEQFALTAGIRLGCAMLKRNGAIRQHTVLDGRARAAIK
jgi:hypothetical protein